MKTVRDRAGLRDRLGHPEKDDKNRRERAVPLALRPFLFILSFGYKEITNQPKEKVGMAKKGFFPVI